MIPKRVLLLGCDGNAGRNYAKSLKLAYGPTVEIYGTGTNQFHLLAAEESGLFKEVVLLGNNIHFDDKINKVKDLLFEFKIQFIHAQPEEEVKFLALAQEDDFIKMLTFGKNINELVFYADKMLVQNTLGFSSMLYEGLDIYDDGKSVLDMLERGGGKAWIRANNGAGSKYALPITSTDDAENWYQYLHRNGKVSKKEELTISPYLPGKEYAVQTFWINGKMIHAQQRERVEHFFAKQMVSGQSSTPSVAVTSNDADVYQTVYDSIIDISEHLDVFANGIYCADLRRDINGNPVITEVNYGRYFTTSDFFSRFGVNTPAEEFEYVVNGTAPLQKIGLIRDGIYWIRGLDTEPIWYTVEDLIELKEWK